MSGRPGSNRPPRPWQGRALPNELLPLFLKPSLQTKKNCFIFRTAKIRDVALKKQTFICIWDRIKCYPALLLQDVPGSDVHINYSNRPVQMLQ